MKKILLIVPLLIIGLDAFGQAFTFADTAFIGNLLPTAPAGGGSTPTNLTGFAATTLAWYADVNTYYSASSGSATWVNLCSNLRTASDLDLTNKNSGTTKQPVAVNEGSFYSLSFDGSNDVMQNDNISSAYPFTICCVLYVDGASMPATGWYYASTNGTSGAGMAQEGPPPKDYVCNDSSLTGYTITNKFYVRFDVFTSSSSFSAYTNNVLRQTRNPGASKTLAGFYMDSNTSGGTTGLKLKYVEFLIITNAIDSTARSELFNYWTNKYGISL